MNRMHAAAFPSTWPRLVAVSFAAIAALLLALWSPPGRAQGVYPLPEALPDLALRVTGTVHAIAAYGDGYVIGGEFDHVNGEPRQNLALLRADGTLADAGFEWIDAGSNGPVHALAVAGNALYAAGDFTAVGGQPRAYLARLSLLDGGVDAGFAPVVDGPVRALAADIDAGGVFIGGEFGSVDGVARQRSAKIGADGALTQWVADYRVATAVHAIAFDAAQNWVYVGGNLRASKSGLHRAVARLHGTTGASDPDWSLKVNPRGTPQVYALAIGSDHVYLGGSFSRLDNVNRANIARVHRLDGDIDRQWDPGANGPVRSFSVDGDAVVVGGEFTVIGGAPRLRLARIDGSGAVDPAVVVDADRPVLAMHADARGLLVGGAFRTINGSPEEGLARLDASATPDPGFVAAIGGPGRVLDVALDPAGGMIVAGVFDFAVADGVVHARSNLLRLAPDHSLDADWVLDLPSDVQALAIDPVGNRLYAGGSFPGRLARFDISGAAPVVDAWAPAPDGAVTGLLLDGNGRLYVRGQFTSIGGASRNGLARLEGPVADAWNPDPSGRVDAMALHGADVFLGGECLYVSGADCVSNLARVDAASASVDSLFLDTDGPVSALLAHGNHLYVGGGFTLVDGLARSGLARAQVATGSVDGGWAAGADGRVDALVADAGRGWIYAGGRFASAGGAAHPNLMRASSSAPGVVDPGWRPGSNGSVARLALLPTGELFLAGSFDHVSGVPRQGVARLGHDGSDATAIGISGIAPSPAAVGEAWTISFQVANLTEPTAIPVGTVTIHTDAGESCGPVAIDAAGAGSCTITSTAAGSRSVTAALAGTAPFLDSSSDAVQQVVLAGVAVTDPATVLETVDDGAVADGVATNQVRVRLADGQGQPVAGVAVAFAHTGSATLVAAAASSDALGEVTATLTSTVAAAVQVTAQFDADGDGTPDTAVVNGSPAHLTFVAGPVDPDPDPDPQAVTTRIRATDAEALADGTDAAEVTVWLVDAFDNPVPGVRVAFQASGASVATPAALSDAAGRVSTALTSATPGTVLVTARFDADGDDLADTDVLDGSPASVGFIDLATTVAITAHAPLGTVVGEPYTVDFAVTGTIAPVGVVLVSDGDGGSCSDTLEAADGGLGSCSLQSAHAGEHQLVASFAGAAGFADSASAPVAHGVAPAATSVGLQAASTLLTEGDTAAFSWNMAVLAPGAGNPDGMVTVSASGMSCSAPMADGGCSIEMTQAGNHAFSASWAGNADFLPATSPPVLVDVQAGGETPPADIVVRHAIVASGILADGSGDLVDYVFEVSNSGGLPAAVVDLDLLLPAQFTDVAWSCTGTGGGLCGLAGGSGDIDFAANLPAGASVLVALQARVVDVDGAGVSTAAFASTSEPEADLTNNSGSTFYRSCSGSEVVDGRPLAAHVCTFRDGFEPAAGD